MRMCMACNAHRETLSCEHQWTKAGTSPAQSAFSAASTGASKSRLLSEVFLMSSSRTISRLSSPTGCVGARCAFLRTPAFQTRRAGMARGVGAGGGCIDPKRLDCTRGFGELVQRCQIRHYLRVQVPETRVRRRSSTCYHPQRHLDTKMQLT